MVANVPADPPVAPAGPGPLKRWVLGARPRTLPAAIVPVVVGTAAAHARVFSVVMVTSSHPSAAYSSTLGLRLGAPGGFWWRALGALVVALAVQVGTNYANDYSDGVRGTDDARVGPLRLVASGLASPASVKRAALMAFGVAAIVGLALAWVSSWWVLLVGAACLAAGWLYTGGPRPYGYAGLGELFVFVFFGLVATVGTFYVETLRLDAWVVWLAAVAVGLLATALLLANNLRDIDTDAVSAKRTLAVRVGRRAGGWCYEACVVLPFVGVAVWAVLSITGTLHASRPAIALLPLAAGVAAIAPIRLALSAAEGRALLPVLAATGRLQLVFGLLLSVALWFWVPYLWPVVRP
jgi:1,4-dihydroxy-2-naphthoate octaprenyltransferase